MTTCTTVLALLPVLTAICRGGDILLPLALPIVGVMAIELLTMFVVLVLYAAVHGRRSRDKQPASRSTREL